MKTQIQYKPLTVGDIRQEGDERKPRPGAFKSDKWVPEEPTMMGHKLLPGDLILNEYRRPI